jgi:hypothetical protein
MNLDCDNDFQIIAQSKVPETSAPLQEMSSSSNPTINASEVELRLWIGKVLVKWNDLARVNRICDILLLRYRSKDQFFSANEFEIINLLGNDPHAVYLISRIYEEVSFKFDRYKRTELESRRVFNSRIII